jgi:DNA-binding response OmpR family regulator
MTDVSNRRPVVLVVDDAPEAQAAATAAVEGAGWAAIAASTGAQAVRAVEAGDVHLVVLDLGLPDLDGMRVLDQIRLRSDVAIIVATGRDDLAVRLDALERGADDYLTKPFSMRELTARIGAVLRRTRAVEPDALTFDDLVIDFVRRGATVGDVDCELRPKEFELLAYLALEPGRVHSRDELLRSVWRSSSEWQVVNTVAEHVRRLRKKIERDPDAPRFILSRRGAGYWFAP